MKSTSHMNHFQQLKRLWQEGDKLNNNLSSITQWYFLWWEKDHSGKWIVCLGQFEKYKWEISDREKVKKFPWNKLSPSEKLSYLLHSFWLGEAVLDICHFPVLVIAPDGNIILFSRVPPLKNNNAMLLNTIFLPKYCTDLIWFCFYVSSIKNDLLYKTLKKC